jgi:acyl dehydratase
LPLEGGIIGAGGEIEWPRPTRPGDTLHVVSEVMEPKRRNRGPIAAWPSYAAKPATSATRSCRFSRRDSSSRAAHDRYYGARA